MSTLWPILHDDDDDAGGGRVVVGSTKHTDGVHEAMPASGAESPSP